MKIRMLRRKFALSLSILIYLLLFIGIVIGLAGNVGDGTSPFGCGSNCQGGGYELSGNSEDYCNSNPVDCYNTIDECKDGTRDTWEYINDINITSLNDTMFRVGDIIEIDVDVYSGTSGFDQVIILYTNNSVASMVNWTVVFSQGFEETISSKHFKVNRTLDGINRSHSIRAIVEYKQYTNITCGTAAGASWPIYSDTDDITFAVLADTISPRINFTSPTPGNNNTITVTSIIINVTHNDTRPAYFILNWNGTNQTPVQWSGLYTNITISNLQQGNYTYYVWINDTSGNENLTETRTLEVITPIDLTIQSPTHQGIYTNSTINLNFTAKSNAQNAIISWSGYSLNGNSNVTAMNKLNITSDLSDGDEVLNESTLNYLNLSQSFITGESMYLSNLSIKIMKAGNGTENATLQIRTDDSGPSSTILAQANISHIYVSNSTFEWVNLSLNSSTALAANTKYWLFLSPNGTSTDYYLWEATDENDYIPGNFSHNGSRDLLFRIFDDFEYRTTILGNEGSNNIRLYANDTSANQISSSTIIFSVDTIPPTFTQITESEDPLEIGNQETLRINVSDASSAVNTVLLELNGSNYTMLLESSPRYYYTWTPNATGNLTYKFYMNDSVGNENQTDSFNITVTDNTSPLITNISYSPNSSEDLFPNVNITITATVSDQHNVDSVILQYKNSTIPDWLNASMSNPSGNTYTSNFTPYTIGNWTFRVWGRDPTGNENTSANYTLYVDYDWNWTLYPSSFETVGGVINTLVNLGNLTINNTGDYNLTFNLSYTGTPSVVFNATPPFIIYAKEALSISINATVPGVEAEYPIVITVDALNASAYPPQATSNITLVAVTSGPYLTVSIAAYDSSVTIGDRIANLAAKITNVGNETAQSVTANWTLPSGWVSSSDLNRSLGNLTTGQFKWHNISVLVSASATTGAQTITAAANCSEGRYNSDSKTVTVNAAQSQDTTPPSSSPGGGGGGGGIAYVPPSYDFTIQVQSPITTMPNTDATVLINITNTVENTILSNITLDIEGYFLTFLDWSPQEITGLIHKETKSFRLKIEIPKYMKSEKYPLSISVKSIGTDSRENSSSDRSRRSLERSASLMLIVQEVGKEYTIKALLQAENHVDEMENARLNTKKVSELLALAKEALEEKDYKQVVDLSSEISSIRNKAFAAKDLIEKIKEQTSNAKSTEAQSILQMLELAQRALSEGDYDLAYELANKAMYAGEIEKGYKESGLLFITANFLKENWAALIIIMLASAIMGPFIRAKLSVKYIEDKIEQSKTEEGSIIELIKKAQQQYFKEKIMSPRLYKKTMDELRKSMTTIEQNRIRLKSRIVKILKFKGNREELEKEISSLEESMRSLQEKYFQKKIITKDVYDQAVIEYNNRKAEIEKTILLLQTRQEKKRKEKVQQQPENKKAPEKLIFLTKPCIPEKEPQRKSKISFDVDPENSFWINNGLIVRNVMELSQALKQMDYDTFFHHVNEEKNDFANWVHDTIGNHALAEKLRSVSLKEEMADIIDENFEISPAVSNETTRSLEENKVIFGKIKNLFQKAQT